MPTPNYSIVFSAQLVGSSTMSVGNIMIPSSDEPTRYVLSSTANRGSRRSEGVALTAYGGSSRGSVQMQQAGTIDATISGLAAGSASWVRCSATGTIERCTPSGSDDIIGYAEADGRVHLMFGVLTADLVNGGGATPGGSISGLFGDDLVHIWLGLYDDENGIWTDEAGDADADTTDPDDTYGVPGSDTVNRHDYPVFDGDDDGLSAGTVTDLDGLESYCIFACFNAGADAFGSVLEQPLQFGIQFASQKVIAFVNDGSGGDFMQGTTSINDSAWHRVILNVDEGAATLYVDGVIEDTSTFSAITESGLNTLRFGISGNGTEYAGGITACGIATRAATVDEILTLDAALTNWVEGGAQPGGSTGDIQYNNFGALGGLAGSVDGDTLRYDGANWVVEQGNVLGPLACTLEMFGAVGDGVTDDTAALNLAVAALNAETYKTLILNEKTYSIASATDVINNIDHVSVVGKGARSVLKHSHNSRLLETLTADDLYFADFAIEGAGMAVNSSAVGLFVSGNGTRVRNITVRNEYTGIIAGGGLDIMGGTYSDCRVEYATLGVHAAVSGTFNGCQINQCTEGIKVSAGNVIFCGGDLIQNTTHITLEHVGASDAHGMFVGTNINHGTYAVNIDDISQPHFFEGCHIYDAHILANGNQVPVVFNGGVIDVLSVTNNDGQIRFNGTVINTAYFSAHTETGTGWTEYVNCIGQSGVLPSHVADRVQCAFTFASDANDTLTAQESVAETLIVQTGVITGAKQITSAKAPYKGIKMRVVNNNAQNITFKWSSGAAITINTGTWALVGSDGTDAIKLEY